jgi:GT2 family glycosyltransferase
MNYPKVSLVILNWNGLEDTSECLKSLQKIAYSNYEIIIVDNCSDGDDAAILKERFGDYIQLVCNDKNYGSAEGYNSGIRFILANSQPKPNYIITMNNDMVVDSAFLTELVEAAVEDEHIGIVGPKIYYYNYDNRNDVIWSAGGKIKLWMPQVQRQIGENDDDLPKYQNKITVDWITGALFMLKSQLFEELGLYYPGYFLGLEDTEYCLRARKRGYRTVYVPSAKVWHKVGASVIKSDRSYADPASYYNFVRRNFPLPVYIYQLLLLPFVVLYWGVLYLIRRRDKRNARIFIRNFIRFISQGTTLKKL